MLNISSLDLLELRLVLLLLIVLAVVASRDIQDPEPQCSDSRAGLPACNFERSNCFHEGAGVRPAWKHVGLGEDGPVKAHKGAYIYLDPKESLGKPRKMAASITHGKKAMCVTMFYTSIGHGAVPLNIYIKDRGAFNLMHHVEANTGGTWESTNFACCLPNVENEKKIAIEATATEDATVAIDYIDILVSDMPCSNNELACYPAPPSQMPMGPHVSAPTCPAEYLGRVSPSCDFSSDSKDRPDTCRWKEVSGWDLRQKIDGSGIYDVIDSTTANASYMLSKLSWSYASICIEIQFSTQSISTDLNEIFSIYLQTGNRTLFSGKAYDYSGSSMTLWKRNAFSVCLPEFNGWRLLLKSNIEGLRIDYIHTKSSQTACESTNMAPKKVDEQISSAAATPKSPTDLHIHSAVDTKPQRDATRSSAGLGVAWIVLIIISVLVMVLSLGAVAWECYRRTSRAIIV